MAMTCRIECGDQQASDIESRLAWGLLAGAGEQPLTNRDHP